MPLIMKQGTRNFSDIPFTEIREGDTTLIKSCNGLDLITAAESVRKQVTDECVRDVFADTDQVVRYPEDLLNLSINNDEPNEYHATLIVPMADAGRIDRALDWKEGVPMEDRFTDNEVIQYTAKFHNGVKIDIKCIGTEYEKPDKYAPMNHNAAETEATLYQDGVEIMSTDCCTVYFCDWELEDNDGNQYIIHVVRETDPETNPEAKQK